MNKIKIGDLVKVNVLKYKNFRGTVTAIENGMAEVKVKTYYGNGDVVTVYQDVRFLKSINK